MNDHKKYIKRCISLAKNGIGTTYPNPLVGSVIVHNDKIIGEGWHRKAGEPHAEVHAINSVKDKSLLKEATIYVSLEPCSHFGKTPPCANLIIENQIPNVVIGCIDTNEKVAGKGIQRLKENGCQVIVGILEKECLALNKRFFTVQNKKRPYIILKWAATTDGYLAPEGNNGITWISNTYSKTLVHKLRAQEQAILVGTQTAIVDNPSLTTRKWFGKNPLRVVIDRNGKIPKNHHLLNDSEATVCFSEVPLNHPSDQLKNEIISFNNPTKEILDRLFELGIQSLIIEGGAFTINEFIEQNLWDEAYVFIGAQDFNKGIKAPILNNKHNRQTIFSDQLIHYFND